MNLGVFQIFEEASLTDALEKINSNHQGIVLTTNASGQVTGLATDGDIRRKLLEGASLSSPIKDFVNPSFLWADHDTTREILIKFCF